MRCIFGFIPFCRNKHSIYLETVPGEIFTKKKNLYFVFVNLEKAFDQVPRVVV